MKDVFFGKIHVLNRRHGKPHIEHLIFEQEGKSHTHTRYESFFVIAGEGQVICGDQTIDVVSNDLVTIAPNTPHWMIPAPGKTMEGFLWYHDSLLDIK